MSNRKYIKRVTLLCDGCDECPEVTIRKNEILIADDFGGSVKLTTRQFDILKDKIKKGQL